MRGRLPGSPEPVGADCQDGEDPGCEQGSETDTAPERRCRLGHARLTGALQLPRPQTAGGAARGDRDAGQLDLANVEVRRENVADYPFEEAGCDWEQYGNWVVTNRFSCTPTWSHLSALADRACAMWNKYAFSGDLTVEFYAGMRQSNQALNYPRIGDMNVTICGDGRRLDSGYSYVVGAWDPGWTGEMTRLLARGG